ncbi:tripartite tricarboxylate transporter TctB family protein [Kocuria sp. M1R5S2]|uniref:tripartite tricarboxylate transporter TctB family protein n=1 Tax=Kocuria rhizosphaerae TaxID=3376285 RepID=UPI003790C128
MTDAVEDVRGPEQDRAPRERRHLTAARRIPAAVLLLLGAGAAFAASQMKIGSPSVPGPGLWPLTVSVLLVLFGGLLVLTRDHEGQERWGRNSLTVLGAVASLAVFIVLFPRIGFTVPAIAMTLLWLKVFGRERWTSAVLLAVAAPVLLYLLFDEFLGVRLPRDLLMSMILGV